MESLGGLGFGDVGGAAKRKRSSTSRRPRYEAHLAMDYRDISSLSSTPPSDDNVIKSEEGYVESDEASNNGSFRGRSEHRLGPADRRGLSKDESFGIGSEVLENTRTVKKVTLKVGGATRTMQTKSTFDGASNVGLISSRSSHISDAPRPRTRSILQVTAAPLDQIRKVRYEGLQGNSVTLFPGAGPFCTNAYKYMDSQSKLPLCSLLCYKAVHEKKKPFLSAC